MPLYYHQLIGLSGSLIGCLCTTAYTPNAFSLRVLAFCGVLASMLAIHWVWYRHTRPVNQP